MKEYTQKQKEYQKNYRLTHSKRSIFCQRCGIEKREKYKT